jgi:hypothetical protein
MEPGDSSPHSHKPSIGPYPEPDRSNPYHDTRHTSEAGAHAQHMYSPYMRNNDDNNNNDNNNKNNNNHNYHHHRYH